MNNIYLLGINQQSAPIPLYEKIAVLTKKNIDLYLRMLQNKRITGSVILSTCNRVELYLSTLFPDKKQIIKVIQSYFDLTDREMKHFYFKNARAVGFHLFRLTSGLESPVLGEPEILGQVKVAYLTAQQFNCTDKITNKLFHKAIETGKKVRTQTCISAGNVSYASIIFKLIQQTVPCLPNVIVTVIGTGKIAQQVLPYFAGRVKTVRIVSHKQIEKAKLLAEKINGAVADFNKLNDWVKDSDVIVCCTSAPHYILKPVHFVTQDRFNRQLIFDLAVPRDVHPEIKKIPGIMVYSLTDLNGFIEADLNLRKSAIPAAEEIINLQLDKLWWNLHQLQISYHAKSLLVVDRVG